jgi:hypothetical protein
MIIGALFSYKLNIYKLVMISRAKIHQAFYGLGRLGLQ